MTHRYVIYQKIHRNKIVKNVKAAEVLKINPFSAALIFIYEQKHNIFLVLRSCREYKFNLLDI